MTKIVKIKYKDGTGVEGIELNVEYLSNILRNDIDDIEKITIMEKKNE